MLEVRNVPGKGRGVFTTTPIAEGEVFERSPVIVSPAAEWPDLEKTVLYNYCYAWGPSLEHSAIALGFGSLFNHSYTPNAVYVRRLEALVVEFVARRTIAAGDEISINYNGDPLSRERVWFEEAP